MAAVESPHFEHKQEAESAGDGRKLLKPHNPPYVAHLLQKATPTNPLQTVPSSRNQVFKHEPREAIFIQTTTVENRRGRHSVLWLPQDSAWALAHISVHIHHTCTNKNK